MAQRLAELCLLEALLDLGAVAVEVLDLPCRALVAWDVGEDEALAKAVALLAVEAELELAGVDVGRRRELWLAIWARLKRTRRTISPSGSMLPACGGVAGLGRPRLGPSPGPEAQAEAGIRPSARHIASVRGTETVKRARLARDWLSSSSA